MILMLILALAVGVGCYFGCYRLGVWTINHGYMAPDAVELRNQRHERSLQQYVASNNVSSRDTVAIEQWLRSEKNASVIVYQAQGDPYEAGTWGTSQLLDDTTQNDLATLGYSFYTVQFADGAYRVALCDYSESRLFGYAQIGALVLAFVAYSCIAFGFTRRLARRVTRLSEAVSAAGALNQTIPVTGTDELARLAQNVNTMRETIVERTRNEQTALQANSDLITAMSHDIRNPLTALLGYLDLAKTGQYRTQEELQSYLDAAYGKAEQLKRLTDELFRYSLLFGCKELPLQLERYDASILLGQLLGESRAQLQQQGFTVQLLLPQQDVQIEADVTYLKRVFDNLFDNIRKYADPARPVAIAALLEDGALHVCLSNSVNPGAGRIESNKIGLRTCAKIMAQMSGSFKRYTENGKFTAEVILPILPAGDPDGSS